MLMFFRTGDTRTIKCYEYSIVWYLNVDALCDKVLE